MHGFEGLVQLESQVAIVHQQMGQVGLRGLRLRVWRQVVSLVVDSVAHQVCAIAPISVQADSGSRAHRTVRTSQLNRAHIASLCCHFGYLGNLHNHSRCLFFLVLLPKSVMTCHIRFFMFGRQLFPLQFQGQALVSWDCIRQIGLENGRLCHCVCSFQCNAVAR